MSLKKSQKSGGGNNNGQRVRVPEDTHPALVSAVYDMGKQFNTDFQSGEIQTWDDGNPKINDIVRITFEFPTVVHEFKEELGPQPLWISKEYNVKSKALLELMSNAGLSTSGTLDLTELGGRLVAVQVGTTSGGNAKITGTLVAKNKMLIDDEVIDTSQFTLSKGECIFYDMDDPDQDIYDMSPDFIKEQWDNQASPEAYEKLMAEKNLTEENNEY